MGTSVKPTVPNGMTSTAAALRYWERRQEVASNNLANVSTGGFKGERVFSRLLQGGIPTPDAATNFAPGSVRQTGNPYDVAVEGQGFLVVQTPNGDRLSRGGSLRVDDTGTLVDANGNALLGDHGVLQVSSRGNGEIGPVTIGQTGIVKVGNSEIGKLRLEAVPPNIQLAHEGSGLFIPPDKRAPQGTATGVIRQGALEDSNVTPVSEMVDMITIQRAYTAVQKAMSTLDSARGIVTTELGRPAN